MNKGEVLLSNTREEVMKSRAVKKKKRRKKRLLAGFVFFLVLALAVGAALSLTVLFPIEDISASGSDIYSEKQIIKASGVSSDNNLFTLSEQSVTEKIRSSLPYIETVSIKRSLPGSITIKVTDAAEYACYRLSDGYYVVNEGGFVMNKYDSLPENTFEIVCAEDAVSCEVGSYAEFENAATESLINELSALLSQSGLSVNSIDVSNTLSLNAKIEGRFSVLFGTSANLDKKVAHLVGMVNSIDPQKTGKINLSMWAGDKTEGSFVEGQIE